MTKQEAQAKLDAMMTKEQGQAIYQQVMAKTKDHYQDNPVKIKYDNWV